MTDRDLEKEFEDLRLALGIDGGSPSLLARAKHLKGRVKDLLNLTTDLMVDIARQSPIRLTIPSHDIDPLPVTTNIVEDLRKGVARIDSAGVSLLIGLGLLAQRIERGEKSVDYHTTHIVELTSTPQTFVQAHSHLAAPGEINVVDHLSHASRVHPEWARDELIPALRAEYPEARVRKVTVRTYVEDDPRFT